MDTGDSKVLLFAAIGLGMMFFAVAFAVSFTIYLLANSVMAVCC